jgi:hypothetical protein
MRIGLIIADFELNYTSTFQHTARVKYGVDFDSSTIHDIALKLQDLKRKIEANEFYNVHVPFEITLEHVVHVEYRLNQIIDKYRELFMLLPADAKLYKITQKLKDADSPTAKELAKEALIEVFSPEKATKPTKEERIKADAERISKQRALKGIKKNSAKKN